MHIEKKTINVFKKDKLVKTFYAPIDYAEFVDEQRVKDECKLHFKQHMDYNFPKDLDFFDFDTYGEWDYLLWLKEKDLDEYDKEKIKEYNEMMEKLNSEYKRDWIDCYEHWTLHFSLVWQWIQCKFDTANRAGIIAVKKGIFSEDFDFYKYFKEILGNYSSYCNGWIYEYYITEDLEFTNSDYWVLIEEVNVKEEVYSNWYFNYNDLEEDLKDNIKRILGQRGIEFDKIEIE